MPIENGGQPNVFCMYDTAGQHFITAPGVLSLYLKRNMQRCAIGFGGYSNLFLFSCFLI